VADRDSWLIPQMHAVRYILTEASAYLSHDRIWTVHQLLAAEEPTEALLCMAEWLAPHRDELPEDVVRLLKAEVGTVTGVDPAFRQ
jgi:hypothetical protein